MKMNAKTGARAKILAYVLRNGLSTIEEIMIGAEEPNRIRAANNIKLAVSEDLLKRLRDDVTNQPGYEITDAGRAWLKKNGKPEAATTPPPEEAKPAAPPVAQAAPAPTPPAPAKPAAKTPAKPAAKAAPAKLPKPKAAAAAVYAAIQDPEQITAPIDPAEQLRQALAENMALSQTIVEICCAIGQDPGKTTTSQLPQLVREHIDNRIGKETYTLLGVLADIRKAIGDDTGKIMLGELAAHIAKEHANLLNDRRDFIAHLEAIDPIISDLMTGNGGALTAAEGVWIMAQLVDAQHAYIREQDDKIATYTAALSSASLHLDDKDEQIEELRTRAAEQARQHLAETGLLAEKNAKLHDEIAHLRSQLATPATTTPSPANTEPDAYIVVRDDWKRHATRHKTRQAAERKLLSVIRGGATKAEAYAATRVAMATRGPVIKTR